MAFGARSTDGVWHLCHRKGQDVRHINERRWPDIEIRFKSQVRAKACADELNEKWKDYSKQWNNAQVDGELFDFVVTTLAKHGGLSPSDAQRLMSEL